MKTYLIAIGVGLIVGLLYGVLKVRSPAPPVVALLGLLGMLVGEQLPPLAARLLHGEGLSVASAWNQARHHMFGHMPGRRDPNDKSG